jgi:iron complex outermembrane receptor protein
MYTHRSTDHRRAHTAIAGLLIASFGTAQAADPPAAVAPTVADDTPPQRVEITGQDGRTYAPKASSTGTKTDALIREVPASLQVISPQLIEDLGAGQSINAVLRTVSGVAQTYGSATGNLPAVSIRGFDTGGYVLVDGYPRSSGSSYDASAIDRIEVLKGPASLLYGMQYSLGGVINLVLK